METDQKNSDVLLFAAADCTGHGVPGALMSMIGNTLLKDITSRPSVTSPAHALKKLDKEIKELLNLRNPGNNLCSNFETKFKYLLNRNSF